MTSQERLIWGLTAAFLKEPRYLGILEEVYYFKSQFGIYFYSSIIPFRSLPMGYYSISYDNNWWLLYLHDDLSITWSDPKNDYIMAEIDTAVSTMDDLEITQDILDQKRSYYNSIKWWDEILNAVFTVIAFLATVSLKLPIGALILKFFTRAWGGQYSVDPRKSPTRTGLPPSVKERAESSERQRVSRQNQLAGIYSRMQKGSVAGKQVVHVPSMPGVPNLEDILGIDLPEPLRKKSIQYYSDMLDSFFSIKPKIDKQGFVPIKIHQNVIKPSYTPAADPQVQVRIADEKRRLKLKQEGL
uniref:Uncharacterized protein n=1 Tax=viral metagenome TaxID=1070528 RepID=A0A6M3KPU0_9ZZZZ